jgi:hypothetical protein
MIGNSIAGFLGSGVAVSASSYESIATAVGTGASGVITFNSIPATYKSLQIRWLLKSATAGQFLAMQFNSDTANNYSHHILYGNGTSAQATGSATTNRMIPGARITGSNATYPNIGIIDIIDYADTSKYKTARYSYGLDANNTVAGEIALGSGLWQSTSAVTTITLTLTTANLSTDSTFALYGIKG